MFLFVDEFESVSGSDSGFRSGANDVLGVVASRVCDRFFLLAASRVWHGTCLRCSQCQCELQTHPSLYLERREHLLPAGLQQVSRQRLTHNLRHTDVSVRPPPLTPPLDLCVVAGGLAAVSVLAASSQSQRPPWS